MRSKKNLLFIIGLASIVIFLGVRIVSAQFAGPSQPPGSGFGGGLRYDGTAKIWGIGADPLSGTKLLIQNTPGISKAILLQDSLGNGMFDVEEGVALNSTTTVYGNLDVRGAITGLLTGISMPADDVTAGVFGFNWGGGHYAFPAQLAVGVSTAELRPADFYVNGTAQIDGTLQVNDATQIDNTLQAGTSTFLGQIFTKPLGGSPATPHIAASNDIDTGIWLGANGAGSVSLNTDGEERLRVEKTANHVFIPGSTRLVFDGQGSESSPAIDVGGPGGGGGLYSPAGGGLSFVTDAADSPIEHMRIATTTGNVGIGTKTPSQKLEVNGGVRLTPTSIAPTALDGTIYYDNNAGVNKFKCHENGTWKDCVASGGGGVSAASAGQVAFYTGTNTVGGNNNFFWNDTFRRLGIGTGNPGFDLHINSASTAATGIAIQNSSGLGKQWVVGTAGSSGFIGSGSGKFFVYDGTIGAHRLVIDANGNIGIGTTAPASPLHISSAAPGALRIVDTTQGAGKVLTSDANGVGTWQTPAGGGGVGPGTQNRLAKFNNVGGTTIGDSQIFDNGTNVGIGTASNVTDLLEVAGTAHLRGTAAGIGLYVNASNNVGVGTIAPLAKLNVHGASGDVGLTVSNAAFSSASDTESLRFLNAGVTKGTIQLTSGDLAIRTDGVSGNDLFLQNSGSGRVGIGNTDPSSKLDVSGAITLRPSGATAGAGRMFFDSSAGNKLKISENGSSFVEVLSGTGSTGYLPKYNNGTTVANSLIYDDGTNVGIGTAIPGAKLEIVGPLNGTLKIVDGSQGLGKVLTSNASGMATWAASTLSSVGASVYIQAAMTNQFSFNYVPFNNEYYDTANMHSLSVNPTRVYAPQTGKYLITATVGIDCVSGQTGDGIDISLIHTKFAGGIAFLAKDEALSPGECSSSPRIWANVSTIADMASNDYVQLGVNVTTVSALTIFGPGITEGPVLSMQLIGA